MVHLGGTVVRNPYPWLEFEVLSWERTPWHAWCEVSNPCTGEWLFRRGIVQTGPSGERKVAFVAGGFQGSDRDSVGGPHPTLRHRLPSTTLLPLRRRKNMLTYSVVVGPPPVFSVFNTNLVPCSKMSSGFCYHLGDGYPNAAAEDPGKG